MSARDDRIAVGDRVRYTFDGSAGVVVLLVTRYRQELAVVAFDGRLYTREIPVAGLERTT